MSYLSYLCLPPHSGVQHMLCSVLCFVWHCLVSNLPTVASFSGLYIHYCPSVFSNVLYFLIACYITLNVQYYLLHHDDVVYSIKHYVIKFTNDLRQVGGFPPPIKLTPTV